MHDGEEESRSRRSTLRFAMSCDNGIASSMVAATTSGRGGGSWAAAWVAIAANGSKSSGMHRRMSVSLAPRGMGLTVMRQPRSNRATAGFPARLGTIQGPAPAGRDGMILGREATAPASLRHV